jgi:hypothetical protein
LHNLAYYPDTWPEGFRKAMKTSDRLVAVSAEIRTGTFRIQVRNGRNLIILSAIPIISEAETLIISFKDTAACLLKARIVKPADSRC